MDRVGEITVGLAGGHRLHRQDVVRRGDFDDERRTDPLTTGMVVGHRRHKVPHTVAEPVSVEAEPACDHRGGVEHHVSRFERRVDVGGGPFGVVGERHCRPANDEDRGGFAEALQFLVEFAEKLAHLRSGEFLPGHRSHTFQISRRVHHVAHPQLDRGTQVIGPEVLLGNAERVE